MQTKQLLDLKKLSDAQWLDVVLGVSDLPDYAGVKLFGMPDVNTQMSTVGRSGEVVLRSIYEFYLFQKELLYTHGNGIEMDSRILDFGCGWGRIIRFFRKDFNPKCSFGADVQQRLLDIASRDVPDCNFVKIDNHPPIKFPTNEFDLIYAYSVFSHIPENMALAWVREFSRILKPGGLLCVTTRPRSHIMAVHRLNGAQATAHTSLYAQIISNPENALARYDDGQFVHFPAAGGADLPESEWGESIISPAYAKDKLAQGLEFIGFFDKYSASQHLQPAIVLRKPK